LWQDVAELKSGYEDKGTAEGDEEVASDAGVEGEEKASRGLPRIRKLTGHQLIRTVSYPTALQQHMDI